MEKQSESIEEHYKVPNLVKGLAVMELLSEKREGMTLQEIKNELDISQTTAYRILNTLVRLGYLLFSDTGKRYFLSRRMLAIGFKSLHERNLLEIVLPEMREIRDVVQETVCFGVLGSEKGIFIDQVLGLHPFCFVLSPGKEFDLHCSAPGKAMLAFMDCNLRERYLTKMSYPIHNSKTISNESDYLKELEGVRKKGYATDREEELSGVICVGAPILDHTGVPCGAIWFSGPKDRLSEKLIREYGNLLKERCGVISTSLGY